MAGNEYAKCKTGKSFEKQQRKVEKIFLKNKKKGLAKAIMYCKKGNPYAALFLDDCMHHGMRLSTSLKEKTAYVGMSTILLKMAADAGHTLSQYKMAKLYEEGKLVPKNNRLAFHYFLQAARQVIAWRSVMWDDIMLWELVQSKMHRSRGIGK